MLPSDNPDASAAVMLALDAEELAYFRLNVLAGKTRSKCAAELGWSMTRIERVRRRLNLHLAKLRSENVESTLQIEAAKTADILSPMGLGGADIEKREGRFRAVTPCRIYSFSRGNSLNPFYRERLSSGLSTWSLCPSKQINIPNYRVIEAPAAISRKGILMNTPDLNAQLKVETSKRDRIAERVHILRGGCDEADRDLRMARAEFEAEQTAAVLEERPSRTENLEKKLAKLQTAVAAKRAELAGAESALEQQGTKIVNIEAEITLRRNETFLDESRSRRERMRSLVEELASLATEHWDHVVTSGVSQDFELAMGSIWPKSDPADYWSNSHRTAAFSVLSAAALMQREEWQKGRIQSEVA